MTRRLPSLLVAATTALTVRSFLLPFGRHFRSLGWRVDAAASGLSGCAECVAAFDAVIDVRWSRNPAHPRNFLGPARQLRRLVGERDYDIVHVHTPVAAFLTRYALKGFRRRGRPKIVYTAHGFHFHSGGARVANWLFAGLERIAGRWTDHLVVINREDEASAQELRIVPSDRVSCLPGVGVDLVRYDPAAVLAADVEAIRRALGLSLDARLFTMVAEFNPGKRHADALRALALLGREDAHLALAGTGPLVEATRALAQRLSVAHRVHFLGYRRDIPVLIRASCATILPSEREGLPRAVLESLALGVPVIGAAGRGITDLLSGGGGWLVPVGDIGALARAMATVLDTADLVEAAGRRGREVVRAYALEGILSGYEGLYSRLLGVRIHAI